MWPFTRRNQIKLQDIKKQIVDVCQRLDARGLVANHDGNVTIKLSSSRFLATPTSFAKRDVTEKDVLLIDESGAVCEGIHRVFSEISLHLAIYRVRPDVGAVVHAHPVTAMGFGISGHELGVPCIPEAVVSLGKRILTTSSFQAGSVSDAELSRVLSESDAFLMPGNGAWAVGQSLLQTYLRLELVEQVARAHFVGRQLGGVQQLPAQLVDDLLKKRPTRKPFENLFDKEPVKTQNERPVDQNELREIVRSELRGLLENSRP